MLSKVSEFIKKAQGYTKFYVAVVGGILIILSDVLPEEWKHYAQVAISIATAFAVYQFPNVVADELGQHEAS
jgi:hypothetical protein